MIQIIILIYEIIKYIVSVQANSYNITSKCNKVILFYKNLGENTKNEVSNIRSN